MTITDAELRRLVETVEEYLREHDTPAKDYAYRAACRERMRKAAAEARAALPAGAKGGRASPVTQEELDDCYGQGTGAPKP